MELNKIYNMDCLDGLKQIESDSIDAIISDPPYQLTSMTRGKPDQTDDGEYGKEVPFSRIQSRVKSGFMNKEWDVLPTLEILKESLRVLKSGAWALWVMTPRQDSQLEFLLRLRQAGFNIAFSSIEWVYASGFPKAMNISKGVDRKLGIKPQVIGIVKGMAKQNTEFNGTAQGRKENYLKPEYEKTIPTSAEAKALDGSYAGMQLKPARELIIVSQKPIAGKTYLDQALLHLKDPEHNQLGGTWLDDGRIPYQSNKDKEIANSLGKSFSEKSYDTGCYHFNVGNSFVRNEYKADFKGRFPANLLVSDNALDIGEPMDRPASEDSGDLSRYFDLDFWFENKLKELPKEQQKIFPFLYVPKASKSERNEGLENMPDGLHGHGNLGNSAGLERFQTIAKNIHPTVKPIKLMSYLITLTTREGDIVLDPFIGSGTTAVASILLNRKFIGFEREKEYYDIANNRLKKYMEQTKLTGVLNDGN